MTATGFSRLKLIKTDRRNRLGTEILEALMRIAIEGPDPDKLMQVDVKAAVKSWLENGRRLLSTANKEELDIEGLFIKRE